MMNQGLKFSITNKSNALKGLEKLFNNYPYKSFYYYNFSKSKLTDFFLEQINKQKNVFYLKCLGPNNTGTFSCLNYLPFDSDIFKLKVGRISHFINSTPDPSLYVDKACQHFEKNGYNFVDLSINAMESEYLQLFQDKGFKFLGTIVTYSIDLDKIDKEIKVPFKGIIREIQDNDAENLSKISSEAFSNKKDNLNRFILDKNLSDKKVGELYSRWFKNCISGEQAKRIFVAEHEGAPVGFIACDLKNLKKLQTTIGSVPLNAVSKKFRRKGIYKALVHNALKWFKMQDCKYVEIRTQLSSLAPQYVWKSFNGSLVKSDYVFHKWFKYG